MNKTAGLRRLLLAQLIFSLWSSPLQASQSENNVTVALFGGRLIDGYGRDPVRSPLCSSTAIRFKTLRSWNDTSSTSSKTV